MSNYNVIASVSEELRRILWEAFQADNVIRSIVGNDTAIVLSNPTKTAEDSSNRLSLWLYQVVENEFVKNQPLMQRELPNRQNRPARLDQLQQSPLALNLFYLVTPFALSGKSDHLLLGKAMQVLYDSAVIRLQDANDRIAEELHVILCRLTLEELTRIWEALREPYRLSVCYQVRVTRIESLRTPELARVTDPSHRFGSKPAEVLETM
jgi:hypothetical protein